MKLTKEDCLEEELKKISKIFEDNGYPKNLIEGTIRTRITTKPKEIEIGPKRQVLAIKLPFIGPKSYQSEKELKSLVRNCYFSVKLRTILLSKPNFTPALKDPIPLLDKSMVVYRFKCCCDNDYIGQTSRRFGERIKEHVPKCVRKFIANQNGDGNQTNAVKNASKKSSIAKHLVQNAEQCGQYFEDGWFEVIRICRTQFELRVSEAIQISTNQPTLCVQQEFDYVTSLI